MTGREAVIPGLTLAALLVIVADFAGTMAYSGIFAQATLIELVVFTIQLGKTAAILGFRRLRDSGFALTLDIYGIDFISLPVLLGAFVWTGYSAAPMLAEQIVLGWIVGVATGSILLASVKTATAMLKAQSLTRVIPLCLATAEAGIQFVNSSSAAATLGGGFDAVTKAALTGYGLLPIASPFLLIDLGAVYLLMLLYSTLAWEGGRGLLGARQLLIAVLATGGTAALVVLGSLASAPLPFVLVPPVIAVAAVSWVIGHKA